MGVKDKDRDLSKLADNFGKKVEAFLKEVGDSVFVTEAYRSQERQDYLYSLGRTVPGNVVTWTRSSNHTQGLAIDIAFRGDTLYPKSMYVWREIAEVANKYGIDWGYDLWETDKPHFQDNGKPFEADGEYRKLVGDSVFMDTKKAGERLVDGVPDERIAIVEKVSERVTLKILSDKGLL